MLATLTIASTSQEIFPLNWLQPDAFACIQPVFGTERGLWNSYLYSYMKVSKQIEVGIYT